MKMIRDRVFQALIDDVELKDLVDNRIFQASNVDYQGKRPLVVIRMHTSFPVTRAQGSGLGTRSYVQLWAHDDPGSYLLIDQILVRCRKILEAVPAEDDFLEFTWIEGGVDLRDDQMNTVCRYARFQATQAMRELT